MVSKCRGYGSICLDLLSAWRDLELLGEVMERSAKRPEIDHDLRDPIIGQALFGHALILYARVHNSQAGRVGFSPAATDDRQRAAHRRMMALRNNGVGHYVHGVEGDPAPWADDRLIFSQTPRAARFDYPYRRHNYRAEDFEDLTELLQLAMDAADRRKTAAEDELRAEIERLSTDEVFQRALAAAIFVEVDFFGSAERAAVINAGAQVSQFTPAKPR
jgi:hypothetical protein